MRRSICLFLALLLILPLISCVADTGGGDLSATDTVSDTDPTDGVTGDAPDDEPAVLDIISGGQAKYVICRPDKASDEIVEACKSLSKAFAAACGTTVTLTNDFVIRESDIPECEILVGTVDRAETELVSSELLKASYTVRIVGKKLVIVGGSDASTLEAVNYFINTFLTGKNYGDGGFSFSELSEYTYNCEYSIRSVKISGTELRDFCIVMPKKYTVSEYRAAILLRERISELYGAILPTVNDTESYGHEIRVGKTARTDSALPDGHKYEFSVSGGSLCLVAGSLYGYEDAVQAVGSLILPTSVKDQELNDGYSVGGDASKTFTDGTGYADRRLGEIRILINNMYGNCKAIHPREQRQRQLAELYLAYSPDVIGLQECNPLSRTGTYSIATLLTDAGYAEVPSPDPANNYTPIFYRTDTLTLLDSKYCRYSNGKDDDSKGYTYGVFKVNATGKVFAVLSTHYWWKKVDATDDTARLSDAAEMLAAKDAIVAKYGNIPVFCGGDFNCNSSSSAYKKVDAGNMTDVYKLAEVSEDLKSSHSYPTYDEENKIYTAPVMPSGDHSKSIDQVFLNDGTSAKVKLYEVVTDLYALLSTDHCPLIIDFDL